MSMLTKLACSLGLAALTLAAAGQAQACALAIQPGQDTWLIQYDPFTDDSAQRQFDVSVVNEGDNSCTGSLRVSLRGEQFGLSQVGVVERVAYALIDERSGSDLTPRTGQSARRLNARPINLAPGERTLLRFTFVADGDELISNGLYSQDALISVEDSNGLTLSERPVSLGVQVISAAVIGLKGEIQRANGIARISLGELKSGPKPLAASLYVLSTGGYRVTVRSENEGRLRLGASDWYVDYALAVGDEDMNLSSEDSFSIQSRRARADDYPLSVRIGTVTGKRAGDYSDVLTFTVAAI